MKFEICEHPGKEWDQFVEKHTHILFYYSVWSEVLQEGLGGRPYYLCLKNDAGIACGMPGVMLTYYGIRLFYSSIPYGGYIGDPALFGRFMSRFREETKIADIVHVSPFLSDRDEEYSRFFTSAGEAATRIDLKGKTGEDVFSRFEPSVRQSLNKSARLGVEVVRCDDRESFLTAHRLYLQTMERNRAIARYTEKWFGALHLILAGKGLAFVCLARYNGTPVSATVVIDSGKGYHLLHSGSCTEQLNLRANDVIVCELLKDAIREGKESVDFMFSDPLDTNLIRWKEKFGGSTSMLNKYSWINSPLKFALWNSAKRVYPLLHRFRKNVARSQS